MAEVLLDLLIEAAPAAVFAAISSPDGLDAWWTAGAARLPDQENAYLLVFSEDYHWKAVVAGYEADRRFELRIVEASEDWMGTVLSFQLEPREGGTWLRFAHTGWAAPSEHFRVSAYCWALYLRLLKRWIELGEAVPFEERLQA